MPSLIYIARIRTLSEDLAQSLRSAGCHVQSFKSGDITQDECMLAMTPEAADAALRPKHASTESDSSHANVPAAESEQQPGRDAAVWDCLKSAIAKELRVDRQPHASVAESMAMELTSTVKEATPRDSNPQKKVNPRQTVIEPPPIVTVASPAASSGPKYIRPAVERTYRVLRNPLSTVAAVLVFAVAYRGLPSIIASERTISRSTMGQALSVEPVEPRTTQRVQRHLSSDGFVAEDFTRRVAMQASNTSARKNIEQSQKIAPQKRTVMN